MTLPAQTSVCVIGAEPKSHVGLGYPSELPLEGWASSLPSALGSYLHKLVALFAGDNEVVTELVLRL